MPRDQGRWRFSVSFTAAGFRALVQCVVVIFLALIGGGEYFAKPAPPPTAPVKPAEAAGRRWLTISQAATRLSIPEPVVLALVGLGLVETNQAGEVSAADIDGLLAGRPRR